MVSLPMCQDCGHYKGQHFVKIGLVDSEAGYVPFVNSANVNSSGLKE